MAISSGSRHANVSSRQPASKGRPVACPGECAANIRAFRLASGLNQPQLAKAVGVTKNAVTNWESGRARPDIDTLKKLCAVLDVSSDALLGVGSARRPLSEEETLLLESYRGLSRHDRVCVNRLIDAMHEDQFNEFRRTFKSRFFSRPLSALSACAGAGDDLSGKDRAELLWLRADDETAACDEILTVSGDSMEPSFHNGDRVLVERTNALAPGEIGIFLIAGEGMIKVYQPDGLHPLNPAYPVVRPAGDDGARCYGRVLGTLREDMLPDREERMMIDEIRSSQRR